MSDSKHRHLGAPTWFGLLALSACCFSACKPAPKTAARAEIANPLAYQLAGARFDTAMAAIEKNRRDEALLLLVSSLKADPDFSESLHSLRELVTETRWFFPSLRLNAELPVEKLAVYGNSLWTSVSSGKELDDFNSTARWNLETTAIEAVLFPRRSETTTAMVLSPNGERAIIQRGSPGQFVALLCDAKTLRPIKNLGSYPETADAKALTPFSADGLLFAQPETGKKGLLWHIRDTATGEIIRSAEQPFSDASAASLDRENLKIRQTDGGIYQIPVSPIDKPQLLANSGFSEPSSALEWTEHSVRFPGSHFSTIQTTALITAAALQGDRAFIGTSDGIVEIHQLLPSPKTTGRGIAPVKFDASRLKTLTFLAEALTGLSFNEETRTFQPLTEAQRRIAFKACDSKQMPDLLDGLDFSGILESMANSERKPVELDSTFMLRDRLSRADHDRPRYLALKAGQPTEPSPQDLVRGIFEEADSEKILATIRQIPANSPAAATALGLSLDSEMPEWITACLEISPQMPPFLRHLALTRIAWLEGRKPDAIALWRDGFPDFEMVRRTEDWDGWESVDFAPRFEATKSFVHNELTRYEIAPESAPEDRESMIDRLLDPKTSVAIGRERHAAACLAAAQETAIIAGQSELTFKLGKLARELGAPPADCLRAEAIAVTTDADFSRAHELWISLISDFPIEAQQSRDYAEAAYTAFENQNNEQAMSILGTGVTHFPNDVDFAYRAGWISLLTAHYQEAYEFLLKGDSIGFPEEKLEKATALIAIAAAATGTTDDAENFYRLLLEINPEWAEPDPPKAEGWPEELKTILRQIPEPPKAIPVEE